MSDDANTIIRHESTLRDLRSNLSTWWQDIAYRVLPAEAQFTTIDAEGTKRTERLFDSTAARCNERFAAVMEDLLTPRTQTWHGLKAQVLQHFPGAQDLLDSQDVREYFEQLTNILFAMRYNPKANFAAQKQQGYLALGAFGNSCLFMEDDVGRNMRYQQLHMGEVVWAEDQYGRIDTVYRKFPLEARKAVKRFGKQLPEKIRVAAEKTPFQHFDFIHCIKPNEERIESRRDYRGMAWSSYYVCLEDKSIVGAGGFRAWPLAIGRYIVATNERYGRSPAMMCWPSIMTLQEEKKTVLRAGQKEVDPPILLTEDGALEPFSLRPGALNFGTVSNQGELLAQPFKTGANVPLGLELMGLEKQDIEDSFLVTVFKVLVENPQMTATQVLEIAQQKGVLLAPTMGRQQAEDLGPLIEFELSVAANAGLLPEVPDQLLELGGSYEIVYSSPLARAQRAQDALAIQRTFEVMPAAIAIDKTAAYVIDVPAGLREIAEINGVPAKLIRDKQAVAQIAQQNSEAEQAAQLAAAAPEMSQAALNAAKAEELRTAA